MQYNHTTIESKWQNKWSENETFKVLNQSDKPKYYVLDMFPYPSGAGLHVGHPLGYIASDIYSRYKRLKGFNVLHPMGYDSFGLPAEQYAIQTGQHPAVTTKVNIEGGTDKQGNIITGYENQLKKLGLSFDWSREIRTSDPGYYKWTQWIFIQLFNAYYDLKADKALPVSELIAQFEKSGNKGISAVSDEKTLSFTAEQWNGFSETEQQAVLLNYRLTFLAEAEVNWCPALGTVLANDEVVNGVSERGGYPVIRKKMTQWMMRITAYADRLLNDLNKLDWPQPIKDSQEYWIGKSKGASVVFQVLGYESKIGVFTTRPDTIFGVSYMALAPEHPLVKEITTEEQKTEIEAYIEASSKRSERERMADVNKITGVFTGAYCIHPFTEELIPVWVADYVLAGYGTGAVMAVPSGDERDYKFAKHFGLPIPEIFKDKDLSENAFTDKTGFVLQNSGFLDRLDYKQATEKIISALEEKGVGKGRVNYRLRDAVFSRQRYWGEPVPAYFKDGVPYMIDEKGLPLVLPEVDEYLPTETGEPPLGRATKWAWDTKKNEVVDNEFIDNETVFPLELNTMPGWAGSSWYFLRYMDPKNQEEFAGREAIDYWGMVDLYLGGSEHATGHLLYSRFWQKFLYDFGYVPTDEYAQKLINQGMILGQSAFVYVASIPVKISHTDENTIYYKSLLVSKSFVEKWSDLKDFYGILTNEGKEEITAYFNSSDNQPEIDIQGVSIRRLHVDVNHLIDGSDELDIEKFKAWRVEHADSEFILENGKLITSREVEKMSKSKYNVLNPDDICEQYGADTLRMYEMFLGPLEQSKPWNTQGISGVYSFLKKFWKLYHNNDDFTFSVSEDEPTADEMKILHQTIKKVDEDVHNFSFNTSVSTFMIAVNELTKLKSNKRGILEPLAIIISPYAPHIAEEVWQLLGHEDSISMAEFPVFEEKWVVESKKEYPVSFNGKMKFKLELPLDLTEQQIQDAVLADERTLAQLAGKTPNKIIIVPGKIINLVGGK